MSGRYLGVPAYDWGVNSIHGIQVSCGANCATNYPLPVAIGAGFNMTMVEELSRMMAIELRALRLEHSCESHVSVGEGGGADPQSSPSECTACFRNCGLYLFIYFEPHLQ